MPYFKVSEINMLKMNCEFSVGNRVKIMTGGTSDGFVYEVIEVISGKITCDYKIKDADGNERLVNERYLELAD